jgi:cobalt-zinc-cadmium efflux system outer membrane protein
MRSDGQKSSVPAAGRVFWLGLALCVFLAIGCTGIQTAGEKQARQQAAIAATSYRPGGQKPSLPLLSSDVTLSNLLAYAMLNQPAVEAAYYDWLASIERITTARSLPDPQMTFQMDIQQIVTSVMPGLMMNFPGPGKLRAGAELASAESQAKYYAFEASTLESAFALKRAYYQLQFLAERIRVTEQNLVLLADLEKLARTQNEVGKVTLQDVLRAQIEQARLRTEIANLQDSRQSLVAQFKAALGLRPDEATPPIPARFESTPLDVTSDKLFERALAQSTRLRAVEAEVHAAEAAITLARRARGPDTSLGLMADVKMTPLLYRPVGSISLPIWRDKIAAQIAEAQANQRVAQARLSSEQIALAVAFAERSYLYREANRTLELLRDQLLPKARQSVEVARSGYLSSRIDFFNLIDSERTLLGFELDSVEAGIQRELALAEISLLVQGMPPSSTPMGAGTAGMARGAGSTPARNMPRDTQTMR